MSTLFDNTEVDNEDVNLDTEVTLEDLVGEGKKYRDPNALAKSRVEADRYIKKLEAEHKQMREELTSRQALADLVDEIKKSKKVEETSNPNPQGGGERKEDPQDVEELVKKLLAEKEREKSLNANQELVKSELTERFGSNFNAVVHKRAKELGVSIDYMNRLAAEAPRALLELFPKQSGVTDVFSGGTQIRSEAIAQRPSGDRDWNYYQKIKKENPSKYWDKNLQRQMFEDMKRLGDKFNLPS